ncbi:MAG: hypothetical protein RL177_1111 [Bacteroidota bacterium]|jgi:RNA polymerase sigma-70 factor (ECF subfamily)
MTMTETQLIHAFLAGHEPSFELIMRRRRDLVYSIALRLIGNADDAQDVTQNVFIKVYHKLHTLQSAEGFQAWLVRITRNACMDLLKSKHRQIMRPVDLDDLDVASEADADRAQQRSLAEFLESALARIPVDQREVVVMKELHQLSFQEIADVLGEPLNTVKSRMYYGLKALHALASTHPQFQQLRHERLS